MWIAAYHRLSDCLLSCYQGSLSGNSLGHLLLLQIRWEPSHISVHTARAIGLRLDITDFVNNKQWRIQGEGCPGGQDPPPLCHDVGFLTLGPKLDTRLAPPPFFLLVDLIWTPPPFKNPGSAPDKGNVSPLPKPHRETKVRMYIQVMFSVCVLDNFTCALTFTTQGDSTDVLFEHNGVYVYR